MNPMRVTTSTQEVTFVCLVAVSRLDSLTFSAKLLLINRLRGKAAAMCWTVDSGPVLAQRAIKSNSSVYQERQDCLRHCCATLFSMVEFPHRACELKVKTCLI